MPGWINKRLCCFDSFFFYLGEPNNTEFLVTSTNLRPAWRKDNSISVWTLATLIRPDEGEARGMGESTRERVVGDDGEDGRVGGKSW